MDRSCVIVGLVTMSIMLSVPASCEPGSSKDVAGSDSWTSSTPITFHPIGVVSSPYKAAQETPRFPTPAGGVKAKVVIFPEYLNALKDLKGFSQIWLIAYMDRARPWTDLVVPHRDNKPHGVFATRSPSRPNSIGLSVVKLCAINNNELEIEGVDLMDNTPVLDIKPYLPEDAVTGTKSGWIDTTSGAGAEKKSP